jgi:hypothetical protein
MLRIENTHDWEQARMSDVLPSVLACIRRFVTEFPEELTEDYLISEVMLGRRQLWVVYDEADPNTALLAVFTESKTYDATSVAFIEIVGIGGERIREALPLIDEIEEWAAEQGAQNSMIIGRFGWIPLLKERGYQKKAVILKKPLGGKANGRSARE